MHVSKYEIFRGWKVLIEWAVYIIPYLIVCVYIREPGFRSCLLLVMLLSLLGWRLPGWLLLLSLTACGIYWSITNHQQTIESSQRERDAERDGAPYLMSTSSNRTQAPVVNHFLFYDKIYLCTIIICNIILL